LLPFSTIDKQIVFLWWIIPTKYGFLDVGINHHYTLILGGTMEKGTKYWHAMSDPALLELLGRYIQQTRLQQNRTQQQVATAAGINRSTMVQIENGSGATMLSFIQILRALEQLQMFENFEPKQQLPSPLELAKMEQKKRQRASTKKEAQVKNPESDW
jgi:transcriptional regulator with XRE-family HTH domain